MWSVSAPLEVVWHCANNPAEWKAGCQPSAGRRPRGGKTLLAAPHPFFQPTHRRERETVILPVYHWCGIHYFGCLQLMDICQADGEGRKHEVRYQQQQHHHHPGARGIWTTSRDFLQRFLQGILGGKWSGKDHLGSAVRGIHPSCGTS